MEKAKKITKEQQKRFHKAKRDLKKLQEEIAPFVRRRDFKISSTAGKWRETSSRLVD